MGTYLSPMGKPRGLCLKLMSFFMRRQSGKVITSQGHEGTAGDVQDVAGDRGGGAGGQERGGALHGRAAGARRPVRRRPALTSALLVRPGTRGGRAPGRW